MIEKNVYSKYFIIVLLSLFPASSFSQVKIFTTDSINIKEWNYNQRKIIRSPELCIIAESKNEIFISYDLGDPVKIFDGKNASLAVDKSSNIHIVFEDNGIRYSSMSYPGNWQPDVLISDSSETGSSPIADCDKDGNVHIVYGVSDSENDNTYFSTLKYVKIYDNQVQISSVIYDMEEETSPYNLVNYTIANHLVFVDETVFMAYQLSNDSIYVKFSPDHGTTWLPGGVFRGTDPKLSVGPGSHWLDPIIENAVFPVLLYLDPVGNLTNSFADFFNTDIYWHGSDKIYDGPIDCFSIDDIIGPFGYSYIFQKHGTLYHAFSNMFSTEIMDTITNNAIASSIAYKQFNLNKVDIVWYENNDDTFEMYYQWFEKIPQPPEIKLTYDQSEIVCYDASDGYIEIEVTGGNPPYEYYWSTGATTQDISNLPAGSYLLTVTDFEYSYYQQTLEATFVIPGSPEVVTGDIAGSSDVNNSDTIIYTVDETAGSVYQWEVYGGILVSGRGSNSVNVRWINPGSGKISTLETNKDGCTGENVSLDVNIIAGFNTSEIQILRVYPNPFSNLTIIQFPNPDMEPYQLSIFNLSGKTVKNINSITSETIEINREGLPDGLYLIEIKGPRIYRIKIIIE